MVLMDEFGTTIHATVKKELIYKFKPLLTEGSVYVMSYFAVSKNGGYFRTTKHEFRLNLQSRTNVLPSSSDLIPLYGFNLMSFNEILQVSSQFPYLIDTIGLLTAIGGEKEYDRDGKKIRMVVLQLESDRFAFEALDRTMRDILRFTNNKSKDKPFGGKIVVLGGDFRQILPIIPRASREEIVNATINSSTLWPHCKVFKLTKNMRLQATGSSSVDPELSLFADWTVQIGDGKVGVDHGGIAEIEILAEFLILESPSPLESIVDFTYPNLLDNLKNYAFFEDRVLLVPTLEVVEMVNEFVLSQIPSEEKEYLSSDSYCIADEDIGIEDDWITTKFLNEIKCSGIPNHKLVLKKGVSIMLLRNIDQYFGLCNGTRLIVEELGNNVIGAIVVTGNKIGEKVYIPQMNLIPSDPDTPLMFQRRQFPVTLCFAMTINKSQGQSLSFVGLFLPKLAFTHGQLYVAISRVKSSNDLKILILDDNGEPCKITKNVVYPEVFQKI